MFAWSVKPFSSACYCDFQGLFHSRLSACVCAQSLSVVQSLSKVMLIYLLSSFFHAFMTFLACILLDLCIGSHDNIEFLEFKSCNFFLHVLFEILIFKHNNWTKIFSCERLKLMIGIHKLHILVTLKSSPNCYGSLSLMGNFDFWEILNYRDHLLYYIIFCCEIAFS